MSNFGIFLTAFALSMDAFAVAICKGLSLNKIRIIDMIKVGLWFGIFQGLMPLIGYLVSYKFGSLIVSINHFVAFFLLSLIGTNMIIESFSKDEKSSDDSLTIKNMFILAVATSIDALAVGISFAFLDVNIRFSIIVISIITFFFSFIGVKVGSIFGKKYKNKAELLGGVILICIGLKILLEHLF